MSRKTIEDHVDEIIMGFKSIEMELASIATPKETIEYELNEINTSLTLIETDPNADTVHESIKNARRSMCTIYKALLRIYPKA